MKIPFLNTPAFSLHTLVGIDLGSDWVRVWSSHQDEVQSYPSRLAVEPDSHKIVAIGHDAQAMIGRVGSHIEVYQPFTQGQLAEPESATAFLKLILKETLRSAAFFRPTVMVSVPAGISLGVRQATVELLYSVGAREVLTIAQPLAAAIGAGVPIADASGSFMFHGGAGVAEGAVISLGSLVAFESTTLAGEHLDQQIVLELKETTQLEVSREEARRIKEQVVSLLPEAEGGILVTGKDLQSGSPKEVTLKPGEIARAPRAQAERYEALLKKLLSRIPPELTADVIDKGMLLSGGMAQLKGLDQFLLSRLGIPVSVVEEPELAVIRGIHTALDNLDLFKESLGYQPLA